MLPDDIDPAIAEEMVKGALALVAFQSLMGYLGGWYTAEAVSVWSRYGLSGQQPSDCATRRVSAPPRALVCALLAFSSAWAFDYGMAGVVVTWVVIALTQVVFVIYRWMLPAHKK